nr:hypothetical protein CFP56_30844 [Quercus suber]
MGARYLSRLRSRVALRCGRMSADLRPTRPTWISTIRFTRSFSDCPGGMNHARMKLEDEDLSRPSKRGKLAAALDVEKSSSYLRGNRIPRDFNPAQRATDRSRQELPLGS